MILVLCLERKLSMRKHNAIPKGKGFALVELKIVMVSVLLLVTVLIPALLRASSVSKQSLCVNNLKQMGQIHAKYTKDHNRQILVARQSATDGRYPSWHSILHEGGYTTEPALLLCPSDPNADPYDYGPAYKDLYDYPISYGYPDYFGDLTAVANQPDNRRLQPKRHNQVRDPSAVLVIADLDPHKGAGNQARIFSWARYSARSSYNYVHTRTPQFFLHYPHDDEVNILMYDGHVESSDPQGEAVKIQWSRLVH